MRAPWSLCDPWAPSSCDLHSERVACARWRWRCARSGWRCHWESQAACGLCARWIWGCSCHLQSARGAMSFWACPVLSRRVASCHVASCRVMSSQVMSCCDVMQCHVVSCPVMSHHVISVTSRHVTSRHVTSRHVMPCYVVPRRVLSCCVVSRREKRPQHIDTATSLSQYASARRSHSHHSHSWARVVLSTSHSF